MNKSSATITRLLFIGLCVLVGLLALSIVSGIQLSRHRTEARWQSAEEHLVAHQDSIISDTQSLIQALESENPARLNSSAIPASLAIPHLCFAEIWPTHVNLVLYANPDTVSGFRVWPSKPNAEYHDTDTSLAFVKRYRYCDDYPISSSNRP
jgi:hypothetical protein